MSNKIKAALPLIHFYVISLCLFFQALTWGDLYRVMAYSNLVLVLITIAQYPQKNFLKQTGVLAGVLVLLCFAIWDWLVNPHTLLTTKPLRHLLLAIGLMVGVAILYRHHDSLKSRFMKVLKGLIYAYTLCQMLAFYVWDKPYGTTNNPHYLAIYSAIFLALSFYLFFKHHTLMHKWLLGCSAVVLGVLLLHTSSRPVWIAVLISILVLAVFLRRRTALKLFIGCGLLFFGLMITNANNFKSRWGDLITNANTEERVTIWHDTWQMQTTNSSPLQWVFGHGFGSFEKDFIQYSRYHLNYNLDFNSPHNIVLELLYQFGVVGTSLVLSLVIMLFYKVVASYLQQRNHHQHAWVYLPLLLVLTIGFFGVSIILPFFVSINLNLLAVVTGMLLYLNNIEKH